MLLSEIQVNLGLQWQLEPEFLLLSDEVIRCDVMWLYHTTAAIPAVPVPVIIQGLHMSLRKKRKESQAGRAVDENGGQSGATGKYDRAEAGGISQRGRRKSRKSRSTLQLPASFPTDFPSEKLAGKVANSDQVTMRYYNCCNCKPVASSPSHNQVIAWMLWWPQLQGPVLTLPWSTLS